MLHEGGPEVSSVLQVAQVTRPLLSIGKICDRGNTVTFSKHKGAVNASDGREICVFHREKGLYTTKLKVKRESSFTGQGATKR